MPQSRPHRNFGVRALTRPVGELTALPEAPGWIYGTMVRTISEEGSKETGEGGSGGRGDGGRSGGTGERGSEGMGREDTKWGGKGKGSEGEGNLAPTVIYKSWTL